MKRIGIILLSAFFVLCAGFVKAETRSEDIKTPHFEKWRTEEINRLESKSLLVDTPNGPIEYVLKGNVLRQDPVVVSLHGGFGGWDQGLVIAENLLEEDFVVLSVSRPGYLRTPLLTPPNVEFTPAQQAQLIVGLLDVLNIPRVAVLGFSAGAPVAFALAQQYPGRVSALVMESLGRSPSEDIFFYSALAAVLSQPNVPDFASYLLYLSTRFDFYSTAAEVLSLDTNLAGFALNERINYVTQHKEQYKFLRRMIHAMQPVSPRLAGVINDALGANYWTTSFNPIGFQIPTLIVQAFNDSNGYYQQVEKIHAQLPTSQLITVEDSGHFLWLGPQTKKWEKQVKGFLNSHLPTPRKNR